MRNRSHAVRYERLEAAEVRAELDRKRWERSPRPLTGRVGMRSARRVIMTTPMASSPRNIGRHVWDSLRRKAGPHLVPAQEQDPHGNGLQPRGPTTRRSRWRSGAAGRQLRRSRRGERARTCRRAQSAILLWALWRPCCDTKHDTGSERGRRDQYYIGLLAPPQLRHWKLSLRDNVAGASGAHDPGSWRHKRRG